jgi:hypothetical protein
METLKKTFNDLKYNDTIWSVYEGSIKIYEHKVSVLDSGAIRLNIGDGVFSRQYVADKCYYKDKSIHNITRIYFCNQADAIRYAKAQLFKELNTKIQQAQEAIKQVVKFKYEHLELLNHQWTEEQINKLERVKQTL